MPSDDFKRRRLRYREMTADFYKFHYRRERSRVQKLVRRYNIKTGNDYKFTDVFIVPKHPSQASIDYLQGIHSYKDIENIIRDIGTIEVRARENKLFLPQMDTQRWQKLKEQFNDFPAEIKVILDDYFTAIADDIGEDELLKLLSGMEKMNDVSLNAWTYYADYSMVSVMNYVDTLNSKLSNMDLSSHTIHVIVETDAQLKMYLDMYASQAIEMRNRR